MRVQIEIPYYNGPDIVVESASSMGGVLLKLIRAEEDSRSYLTNEQAIFLGKALIALGEKK